MARTNTFRIGPTAHYTAYLWHKRGLSPRALATPLGRLLYGAVAPVERAGRLMRPGFSLQDALVCRHLIIDAVLADAIEAGRVGQVVELAAGLSGRGLRMMERYAARGLTWTDGDLPGMAAEKRRRLQGLGPQRDGYAVRPLDLMAEAGPLSLGEAVAPRLRPGVGTAIITEGLIPYFPREDVAGMWGRIGALLRGTDAEGCYLASIWLGEEFGADRSTQIFSRTVGIIVGDTMHLDFQDAEDIRRVLSEAGMELKALHHPDDHRERLGLPGLEGVKSVRILEAWVG